MAPPRCGLRVAILLSCVLAQNTSSQHLIPTTTPSSTHVVDDSQNRTASNQSLNIPANHVYKIGTCAVRRKLRLVEVHKKAILDCKMYVIIIAPPCWPEPFRLFKTRINTLNKPTAHAKMDTAQNCMRVGRA
jgi:hypothetical protein